jgi:Fe-S cluster biogenesis protein NfuA
LDDNIKGKIKQTLDEKVRPMLQMDGGDVELVEVADDGVVKVRLTGGCSGCPMAGLTLTMTVERILKDQVPEVVRVQPVD